MGFCSEDLALADFLDAFKKYVVFPDLIQFSKRCNQVFRRLLVAHSLFLRELINGRKNGLDRRALIQIQ